MSEGTPKAIEMKGIVRNATKIGVLDGQAEDLINLRFMDGSWRASGNGRQIENMPTGTIYEQLYVHTNVYHHLLGVDNGVLYWFAEIDNDGVTFYPLDGTSDRSLWPEDKQDLPTEPVALTTVTGSMWITQTGHLLTIIDEADDFEHFVFKTSTKEYIEVNMDVNGKQSDRSLYPFGQVHFNWYSKRPDLLFSSHVANLTSGQTEVRFTEAEMKIEKHKHLSIRDWPNSADAETTRDILKTLQGELRAQNKFSGALLVCAAVRLYDGSYAYASNPVLICPRQKAFDKKIWLNKNDDTYTSKLFSQAPNYSTYAEQHPDTIDEDGLIAEIEYGWDGNEDFIDSYHVNVYPYLKYLTQLYNNNVGINRQKFYDDVLPPVLYLWEQANGLHRYLAMLGYDLTFSIDDIDTLFRNKDIFTHLCIFVTPDVDTTNINNNEASYTNDMRAPRDIEDILYDLLHSPLFLLKEYKVEELGGFQTDVIIDLSHIDDNGLLEHDNIVQKKQLSTEALSRTTYLPKVSYMYNGRLHIANYKSHPFFGYPIDLFHLHNHSVKVQDGAWFPADQDGQRVLPNLADNNDDYLQYEKSQKNITYYDDLVEAGAPYFLVKVYIDSSQGEQVVCRYIPAYDPSTQVEGRADFIEDLNPLLTYPDARAKKMQIYYVDHYTSSPAIERGYYLKRKEFTLKPHPYLNMAYYIDPELKPIKLSDFDNWPVVQPIQ